MNLAITKELYTLALMTIIIASLVATVNSIRAIRAQPGINTANSLRTPPPKVKESSMVIQALSGIDDHTGTVVSWATAHNTTRYVIYNATAADIKDRVHDGFTEIAIVFPNRTVNVGDEYKACTLVLKDLRMVCGTGFISPTIRPEYNDLSLHNAKVVSTEAAPAAVPITVTPLHQQQQKAINSNNITTSNNTTNNTIGQD